MPGSEYIRMILISSLAGALLVLLLILFVLTYQRRLLRQQRRLQNLESEHRKALHQATLDSQERERHRMATELHDGLGALLATIRMRTLRQARQNQTEETEETAELLAESIETVRRIAHDLLPPSLETLGLADAVEELAEHLAESSGLSVEVNTEALPDGIPQPLALPVFRITQELLHNTLRHAEASRITLRLGAENENVELQYTDNGKGLPPELEKPGLGLLNIRSRVDLLDGSLDLFTPEGGGMGAHVVLPVAAKPATTTLDS